MKLVTVLYARRDSFYKSLPGVDVWDEDRDARLWLGGTPVVAHPPCRAWGRLRAFANPKAWEKDLARHAVSQVRQYGGVLEHPAFSLLWLDQGLPLPCARDVYRGWTLPVAQHWFGHRAEKMTWLYVVGVEPREVPDMPLVLGHSSHVIGTRKKDGRPSVSKKEREATPELFAQWLVDLARLCRGS